MLLWLLLLSSVVVAVVVAVVVGGGGDDGSGGGGGVGVGDVIGNFSTPKNRVLKSLVTDGRIRPVREMRSHT